MPIEMFQQSILKEHNSYRKRMCAGDLVTDEKLHEQAEVLAHSLANGANIPPPKEYSINVYEEDTGDPSKTTGE